LSRVLGFDTLVPRCSTGGASPPVVEPGAQRQPAAG
jgi:hypothetical protein